MGSGGQPCTLHHSRFSWGFKMLSGLSRPPEKLYIGVQETWAFPISSSQLHIIPWKPGAHIRCVPISKGLGWTLSQQPNQGRG